MAKLYLAKGTVALASHLAVAEANAPIELAWLDFKAAEQRTQAYLKINPKGRVPALVLREGTLTETPAILRWIVAAYPESGLLPEGAFARGRVDEMMAWLASTMHVAHAHKMRGHRWADDPAAHEAMKAKVTENMTDCAAFAERQIDGPFLLGERLSIADCHLYAVARWLPGDGVVMQDFPRLAGFMAAVEARPAAARILPLHG